MGTASGLAEGLKQAATLLSELEIPFCLAGGWAVGMWAVPRATEDIDFLAILAPEDMLRVSDALSRNMCLVQSHTKLLPLGVISIWRNTVLLADQEEPVVLDFLLAVDPVLASMLSRRVEVPFQGISLPVIAIEDLILLKMLSGRPQDHLDVVALFSAVHPMDRTYLEATAQKLGLECPVK